MEILNETSYTLDHNDLMELLESNTTCTNCNSEISMRTYPYCDSCWILWAEAQPQEEVQA